MCEENDVFWKQKQNKNRRQCSGVEVHCISPSATAICIYHQTGANEMVVVLLWMMLSLLWSSIHYFLATFSAYEYTFVVEFWIQMEICVYHFFLSRSLSFHFFSFHRRHCRLSFFLLFFFCLIVGDFLVVFQLSYISHAFHFVMRIQWPVDGADQLYTACVCLNFNTRTPFSDNLYFLRSLSLFLFLSLSVWGLSIACIICSTLDELFLKALWTGWNHAIHFMRRKQKTEMR